MSFKTTLLSLAMMAFTTGAWAQTQSVIDSNLLAELDEVIIISYGTSNAQDLTGSLVSVKAKHFKRDPLPRQNS
ncbi:MAG: hypothetical protein GWO76_04300 [Proteobacteria bacterium]|nr:hypothetical protein [Pseudomonadota bacterium]